jgi:hypothetical protein
VTDLKRGIRTVWKPLGPFVALLALKEFLQIPTSSILHGVRQAGVVLSPYLLNIRVVWLVVFALSVYFMVQHRRHRRTPLAILDATVTLSIDSPDGKMASATRDLLIRANHDRVTGYRRNVNCDGWVEQGDYTCDISHASEGEQKRYFSKVGNGWQIVHEFPELPRPLFRAKNVRRKESVIYRDALTAEEEEWEFGVMDGQPYRHAKVKILFHPDRPFDENHYEAIRITGASVTRMKLLKSREGDRRVLEMDINHARPGERFKIKWRFVPVLGLGQLITYP